MQPTPVASLHTMTHIEHNEIFDLAFRFVTETSENVFLTGNAGTGKTTFLKYLKDNCSKNIVVAAPTGVAAINAGGVTLHSLFQLPFHPFLPNNQNRNELLSKVRYTKQRLQLLRKMEVLVIDEISMVRCDTMDAIDCLLKSARRNHTLPFGGVQLLCIGDLYQLSPVATNPEWSLLSEFYNSPFFFDSQAIAAQTPLLIELTKIYRQKEDSFIGLLNKVRNNEMDAEDFDWLHQRYIPGFKPAPEENYITLTSHNRQADQINEVELYNLNNEAFTYEAVIENEFPENMYPVGASLELKEGAQVMFLKNDAVQKRYFNGKIAVIKSLSKDSIVVTADNTDITVSPESWENTRYTLNRENGKLQQETLGSFSQYPLRLAWAITIHKSQGLTFDKVMIDAGAAFSSGQVYVALSRCTSLQGIVLLSKIPNSAIYSNPNVKKGQELLEHRGSLAERFAGARQLYTQELLENIFTFPEMISASEQLLYHINKQQERLTSVANQATALQWSQGINNQILSAKNTGEKFLHQVSTLMKVEPVIENNLPLQQRIKDAAGHFIPLIQGILEQIGSHPLITEHKETATIIDEYLHPLYLAAFTAGYYLDYCTKPFLVIGYLQHRLQLSLPRIKLSVYASGKKEQVTDIANPELYDTLKRWRDIVVSETGMAIYMVANQASLKEVCYFLPKTKKDLQLIKGFGKAKAEKYGDEILDAVESYCSRHGIESNMLELNDQPIKAKKASVKDKKSDSKKPDTKKISLSLFRQGKSVAEIAEERKLTLGTIEVHLLHFITEGEVNVDELISTEKQTLIRAAIKTNADGGFTKLMEGLPKEIGYNQIRMVLAADNKL